MDHPEKRDTVQRQT